MKLVDCRPSAESDAAARKLIEIANGIEAVQDGRIYIELVSARFWRRAAAARSFVAGSSGFTVSDQSVCHANTVGSNGLRLCQAGDRTLL